MSQTRRIRKPALKLVPTAEAVENNQASRIMHDSRGTAVWVGGSAAIEDLSSLSLMAEPSATPVTEGDPYNRPAVAYGSRSAPSFKGSTGKRRR